MPEKSTIYAHSGDPESKKGWESLEQHSTNVGCVSAEFGRLFGASGLLSIAGLLHDVGKAKPAFQRRLMGSGEQVSHSGEGARLAVNRFGCLAGRMIAYAIAGHHSGIPNATTRPSSEHARPRTTLDDRLTSAEMLAWPDWAPTDVPALPRALKNISSQGLPHFEFQFLIRMIFSGLVDADSLETERFYDPSVLRERLVGCVEVRDRFKKLRITLDERLSRFPPPRSPVDVLRAEVLSAVRAHAKDRPGLFSLTVPTGGGKTLASLAFALDHAIEHDLRRIIHVAPFTSIIEQTADVFRDALGDRTAVLEHHSDFDPFEREDEEDAWRTRLAAENWARPVVVTTAVQFFESLFANRRSRCRKLHNISQSVIVLDEAQAMPAEFLRACLAAVQELARGYGCTIVFCTATQPALWDEDGLKCPEALPRSSTTELAPDPAALHMRLRRVEAVQIGLITNDELCAKVAGRRALVIVNNKAQARAIFNALRSDGGEAFHLSTNMTPAHRRAVLAQIKETGVDDPCPVISTSLVEAGVDLDFPEVWRAIAGVDSLVQAAGRCNRNGKLEGLGRLFVFEPEGHFSPPSELARRAALARDVLQEIEDPISPEAVRLFFQRLFQDLDAQLDAKGIMNRLRPVKSNRLDYPFADVAHDMRIIPELTAPLIIGAGPWGIGDAERRILDYAKGVGGIARAMQRFSIPVMPRVLNSLIAQGAVNYVRPETFGPRFALLMNSNLYDVAAGFSTEDSWDLGFMQV